MIKTLPLLIMAFFSLCLVTPTFAGYGADSTMLVPGRETEANWQPQEQYQSIPTQQVTTVNANDARRFFCPQGMVLATMGESNVGFGSFPVDSGLPRSFHRDGNFTFIPRCNGIAWMTNTCHKKDWVRQYDQPDVITLGCVPAQLSWRTVSP